MALWEIGRGSGNYKPDPSMPKTSEADILRLSIEAVRKYLISIQRNYFHVKVHGSGYQRAGVPDVYLQVAGIAIWIEFKRPGADTTKIQRETLRQLASCGACVGIARSPREAVELVKGAIEWAGGDRISEKRPMWLTPSRHEKTP